MNRSESSDLCNFPKTMRPLESHHMVGNPFPYSPGTVVVKVG
jgi:hypothetical protein